MSPVEILRAAREKISDPARWTQEDFARDKDGVPVSAISPDAVCWCARGAIDAVDHDGDQWDAVDLLRKAVRERTGDTKIAAFNDSTQHVNVMAAFDRAIELAGSPS